MPEPRRLVLGRIAQGLGLPNPETITLDELRAQIDKIPLQNAAGIVPAALHRQLTDELDGARPLF